MYNIRRLICYRLCDLLVGISRTADRYSGKEIKISVAVLSVHIHAIALFLYKIPSS